MPEKKYKILVVRNDKLGDFVLSLPAFLLLRKYLPNSEIHAFIPSYTKDIASMCNFIDYVIIDPGKGASIKSQFRCVKKIKKQNYDAIITMYSTTRVGLFSYLSGIKYRLAPATKIAQIFYNHTLKQRRSRSEKPEFEYNLDLAAIFLNDMGVQEIKYPEAPFIQFIPEEITKFKKKIFQKYSFNKNTRLIYVHPGSGGSATNLNIKQYALLITHLNLSESDKLIITAGPGEELPAKNLSTLLGDFPHVVYNSTQGLVVFTKFIQLCDLFISSSTGPLHIAGALNKQTAAFYQRRRSATPLRWQTLNSNDKRLIFTPPDSKHESDLESIDVISAAKEINEKFLNI